MPPRSLQKASCKSKYPEYNVMSTIPEVRVVYKMLEEHKVGKQLILLERDKVKKEKSINDGVVEFGGGTWRRARVKLERKGTWAEETA